MSIGNLIADIDPGPSLGNAVARKTLDLATDGAQGTKTLFTVVGTVLVRLCAICTKNLAGATGTISIGIAGATAAIIALTTATDIDANDIWHDATPDASIESVSTLREYIITGSKNIIATIATADLTDGILQFYCFWEALADGSTVVAA